MVKKIIIFVVLFFLVVFSIRAQDTNDLQKKISEYQEKLRQLGQQRSTLSSQIQYMDTQIYLTTLQINQTQQKIVTTEKEIEKLGSRIEGLDESLTNLSELLIQKIVQGYKQKSSSLFDLIFDSQNASELLAKIKYVKTARDNNQKLLVQVQETKSNAEEQKKIREEKKTELDLLTQTLTAQQVSLNSQKSQKQKLLAETQNDEATYQRLLGQAQAQLAGFGRFVSTQGGASILNNQTVCDDWGCYYNQRDSQWGGVALNNTGYTLAGEGCLVTSMAMVYSHFGHRNVNPLTINNNSQNFASYYPAYLNKTITADGATSTRISSDIDSELSVGRPVIVGISYDGGSLPDHFVVLISGSNGNYQMNDPFTPNGHNIPFSDHYSVGSIREIDRISI